VIPVFNSAKHIAGVFDVLSEQTYGNFEVIFVVDRKTTDDSLKLIESEKERLPEVKAIIQEGDTKLGGARNEGLWISAGEIIWFLDVDDRPVPDLLEYTVAVMEKNDADVVMFNSIRSFSPDVAIPDADYKVDVMDKKEAMWALMDLQLPVTAWSKIILKSLLTENNIEFPHGYAEDVEHTYLTLGSAKKVCFCERPLYIYIQNEGSICNSGKHNNARGKAEIATYAKLEGFFAEDPEIIERVRVRSALMRIRSAVHMDKEAFKEYAKSEECRTLLKKNLRGSFSPEVFLFRVSPSFYYFSVSFYLKRFYYKDGRLFRKPKRAGRP